MSFWGTGSFSSVVTETSEASLMQKLRTRRCDWLPPAPRSPVPNGVTPCARETVSSEGTGGWGYRSAGCGHRVLQDRWTADPLGAKRLELLPRERSLSRLWPHPGGRGSLYRVCSGQWAEASTGRRTRMGCRAPLCTAGHTATRLLPSRHILEGTG